MSILLYVVITAICLLLAFFSFLRNSAIFHGGTNSESFLYGGGTNLAALKARRRRLREDVLRLVCFLLIALPLYLAIGRQLGLRSAAREAARGRSRPVALPVYQADVEALAVGTARMVATCASASWPRTLTEMEGGGRGWEARMCVARRATGQEEPRGSAFWLSLLRFLLLDIPLFVPRLLLSVAKDIDHVVTKVLIHLPLLPSKPVFLTVSLLFNLYYVWYHLMSHRETDPDLRRHNDTRWNRFLNWLKYRWVRRLMWYIHHPIKRLFAVELVPAYGPLPMFTFPAEENRRILREAQRSARRRQMQGRADADGTSPTATQDHHRRSETTNMSGGESESASSEDDWDAEELRQLQLQTKKKMPQAAGGRASSKAAAAAAVAGEDIKGAPPVSAPANGDSSVTDENEGGKDEEESGIDAGPLHHEDTKSFSPFSATTPGRVMTLSLEDVSTEDPCGASYGSDQSSMPPDSTATALPSPMHSSTARGPRSGGSTNPPSSTKADATEKSKKKGNVRIALPVKDGQDEKEEETPKPAINCAQYFFAAHPHGILPACTIISLLSNFMGRNERLFIDNRGFPSVSEVTEARLHDGSHHNHHHHHHRPHPRRNTEESAADADAIGSGEYLAPSTRLTSFSANSSGSSQSHLLSPRPQQQQQQQPERRSGQTSPGASAFTVTHTRHMSTSSPAMSPNSTSLGASVPTSYTAQAASLSSPQSPPPPLQQQQQQQQQPPDDDGAQTYFHTPQQHQRYKEGPYDSLAYSLQEGPLANPAAEEALHSHVPPRYARARHYVYNKDLARFVLQADRDEALPPAGFQQNKSPYPPLNFFTTRIRAVVATFPFFVPIMREAYMLAGLLDATYTTCRRVLGYNNRVFKDFVNRYRFGSVREQRQANARTDGEEEEARTPPELRTPMEAHKKPVYVSSDDEEQDDFTRKTGWPRVFNMNHLLVFPGGASEALLSASHGPTRLLLRRRRGFIRLALQMHSGLVPVFTFGETDYYEQYSTTSSRFAALMEDDADEDGSLCKNAAGDGEEERHDHPTAGDAYPHMQQQQQQQQQKVNEEAGRDDGGYPAKTERASAPRRAMLFRDTENTDHHYRYYAQAIPSSADDEASIFSSATSPAVSLSPSPFPTGGCGAAAVNEGKASALTPEQQMLAEDWERRRRVFRDRQSATTPTSSEAANKQLQDGGGSLTTATTSSGTAASGGTAARRGRRSKPSRLPKWLQRVQVLVQQTFGVSLPFLKNVLPKSGVKAMTVVGRPLFFDLPPEVERMYADPEANYDKELERPILAAAQEVYFAELKDLFNRYAPIYYADHSRRKLIII